MRLVGKSGTRAVLFGIIAPTSPEDQWTEKMETACLLACWVSKPSSPTGSLWN